MKKKSTILWSVFVIATVGALIYVFRLGGAVAGLFEIALLYAITNPDKTSGYVGTAYKQLSGLSFWFEKNAVKRRLESIINLSAKRVNEEGIDLLKHTIEIKWVEPPQTREAFLKADKMVVCLEPSTSEARNVARASILYANESVLSNSRRLIHPLVLKAAVFAVTRKMLMMDRKLDALDCLNDEYFKPTLQTNPDIGDYVQTMEKLDNEGLFTRVFLKELSELDAKFPQVISDPEAEEETKTFLDILKRLVNKQKGVDADLTHRGHMIDANIMLVAREGNIDPAPYVNYAKRCCDTGLERLYVIAMDDKVGVARTAVALIKAEGSFSIENEWHYKVKYKKVLLDGYLAVLNRKNA